MVEKKRYEPPKLKRRERLAKVTQGGIVRITGIEE